MQNDQAQIPYTYIGVKSYMEEHYVEAISLDDLALLFASPLITFAKGSSDFSA